MMDILMSETCRAHKKWNKIASDIKLVFHSSTLIVLCNFWCSCFVCSTSSNLYFYHCSRCGSRNQWRTSEAWWRRWPRCHRTRPHIREDRQTRALQMGCAPPRWSSVRRLGEHNRPDTKAQRWYSLVFQASKIISARFQLNCGHAHVQCSVEFTKLKYYSLQKFYTVKEQHLFSIF